jgi:hypothetical protein
MISAERLIGREACRRYDDNGYPMLTASERALLALRSRDWISAADLCDDIGCLDDHERMLFSAALYRLAKQKRIEKRTVSSRINEYRLSQDPPVFRERPEREYDADGNPVKRVVQPESDRKKMNRARRKELGLCARCPLPRLPGGETCEHHRNMGREYQRKYEAKKREARREAKRRAA